MSGLLFEQEHTVQDIDIKLAFQDVNDFMPKESEYNIDPLRFTKEAMMKKEGMSWIKDFDFQLICPSSKDLNTQRFEIQQFKQRLLEECDSVESYADLCNLLNGPDKRLKILGIDTETTGLDTRIIYEKDLKTGELDLRPQVQLVGLCLSSQAKVGNPNQQNNLSYYLPVRHTESDGNLNWNPQVIVEFMDSVFDDFLLIYYNSKYDVEIFSLEGCKNIKPYPYQMEVIDLKFLWDVEAKLFGLKGLTKALFNIQQIEINELFGDKNKKDTHVRFELLPASAAVNYAAADSCFTLGAFYHYLLEQPGPRWDRNVFRSMPLPILIEHRLIEVLQMQARQPCPLDYKRAWNSMRDAVYRLNLYKNELYSHFKGTNVDPMSPRQLSRYLFDDEKGPKLTPIEGMQRGKATGKNTQGDYSVDSDTLDKLVKAYPDIAYLGNIAKIRSIQGFISKYYLRATSAVWTEDLYPFAHSNTSFRVDAAPTTRLVSACNQVMSGNVSTFDDNYNYKSTKYVSSTCGMGWNQHAIASDPYIHEEGLEVKFSKPVPGWDIDFNDLYGKQTWNDMIKLFAENDPRSSGSEE